MTFSNKSLNQETIRNLLSRQDVDFQSAVGIWKRAAVLALFVPGTDGLDILLTRRTDTVLDHKGQVAFPGGAVEPGDVSLEDTALREAWEEIGLDPRSVTILGRSRDMFTITGWWITPVVGWYERSDGFIANPAEVSRIFSIPVNWLIQPTNWEKRSLQTLGKNRENVIFYQQFDGELLWGVTAELIHDLLKKLVLMK